MLSDGPYFYGVVAKPRMLSSNAAISCQSTGSSDDATGENPSTPPLTHPCPTHMQVAAAVPWTDAMQGVAEPSSTGLSSNHHTQARHSHSCTPATATPPSVLRPKSKGNKLVPCLDILLAPLSNVLRDAPRQQQRSKGYGATKPGGGSTHTSTSTSTSSLQDTVPDTQPASSYRFVRYQVALQRAHQAPGNTPFQPTSTVSSCPHSPPDTSLPISRSQPQLMLPLTSLAIEHTQPLPRSRPTSWSQLETAAPLSPSPPPVRARDAQPRPRSGRSVAASLPDVADMVRLDAVPEACTSAHCGVTSPPAAPMRRNYSWGRDLHATHEALMAVHAPRTLPFHSEVTHMDVHASASRGRSLSTSQVSLTVSKSPTTKRAITTHLSGANLHNQHQHQAYQACPISPSTMAAQRTGLSDGSTMAGAGTKHYAELSRVSGRRIGTSMGDGRPFSSEGGAAMELPTPAVPQRQQATQGGASTLRLSANHAPLSSGVLSEMWVRHPGRGTHHSGSTWAPKSVSAGQLQVCKEMGTLLLDGSDDGSDCGSDDGVVILP